MIRIIFITAATCTLNVFQPLVWSYDGVTTFHYSPKSVVLLFVYNAHVFDCVRSFLTV